jgi:hypothetical protein
MTQAFNDSWQADRPLTNTEITEGLVAKRLEEYKADLRKRMLSLTRPLTAKGERGEREPLVWLDEVLAEIDGRP